MIGPVEPGRGKVADRCLFKRDRCVDPLKLAKHLHGCVSSGLTEHIVDEAYLSLNARFHVVDAVVLVRSDGIKSRRRAASQRCVIGSPVIIHAPASAPHDRF